MTKFLITGTAGFIGFHISRRLLADGHSVLGYDGLTPYYDIELKRARLSLLCEYPSYSDVEAMLENASALLEAVAGYEPDVVIHLAAQAGVRYSLEAPATYLSSNVIGTHNLLECLRQHPVDHLLVASTSSVYGANPVMPFVETARTDFPMSLYAATKKSCEAIAHSYSSLFGLPTTCFRFFTVYGPWGRPDMALFKFTRAILAGEPIDVYGQGDMRRDFTYIDDLVESVVRLTREVPVKGTPRSDHDSISPVAPFRTVNIAGGHSVELRDFIQEVERALGSTAEKLFLPMQPGDVVETHADPALLRDLTDFCPRTPVAVGVQRFVDWYLDYHSPK